MPGKRCFQFLYTDFPKQCLERDQNEEDNTAEVPLTSSGGAIQCSNTVSHYPPTLPICDVIEQNESELTNTDFKIKANKAV